MRLRIGACEAYVDKRVRPPGNDDGKELRKGLVGHAHVSLLAG
jgi:hypothetical protein